MSRNFAPTIRLLVESIKIWQGLEAELGADLEVSVHGGLLLAENEAKLSEVIAGDGIRSRRGLSALRAAASPVPTR